MQSLGGFNARAKRAVSNIAPIRGGCREDMEKSQERVGLKLWRLFAKSISEADTLLRGRKPRRCNSFSANPTSDPGTGFLAPARETSHLFLSEPPSRSAPARRASVSSSGASAGAAGRARVRDPLRIQSSSHESPA